MQVVSNQTNLIIFLQLFSNLLRMQKGSTATHLHVLSPASNGLFQRAIMASGVAINPWAYTYHDRVPALLQYGSD